MTHPDSGPGLLKVEEVAALLNVSRWFVYDHGDELGLVKIGGANRYRLDRVEEYIARQLDEPVRPVTRPAQRPLPTRASRARSRRVPLLDSANGTSRSRP
jgi:hypothetical protein